MRRRQRVEPEIFSNPSVHQASRRKSAKELQTARAATGGVSGFRVGGAGSLKHDIRHNGWLVATFHYVFQPLVHRRTNVAILIELRVGLQKVRVELRLGICGLDDRDPNAPCAQLVVE